MITSLSSYMSLNVDERNTRTIRCWWLANIDCRAANVPGSDAAGFAVQGCVRKGAADVIVGVGIDGVGTAGADNSGGATN
jgi:hypothetical protein